MIGMLRWVWVLMLVGVPGAQTPMMSPFQKGPVPFALLREGWVEDLEAHRLLASVGRYSPDADFLSGDGSHVEGIGAIRTLFTAEFAKFDATIQLTSRVTSESGELAYDSGSYREDLMDRGSKVVSHLHGDYLTIYRRNGMQWLIVQQAWTMEAAK